MLWLFVWIGLLIVSAGGIIVSAHGVAFERGVAADMHAVEDSMRTAQSPPTMPSELPQVVERYLTLAGADGAPVRSVRVLLGGTMRSGPAASWSSVHGTELLVADPPGFVWWGRTRLAPGLWVDARDELASGAASTQILAESIFPLADGASPALDESAAARVLGEMVLFPTSFRDTRYVRWESVDASRARAVLRLGGREVAALFEFGADGLPTRISAKRARIVDGASVLTPWLGTVSDYREVGGLRIPFRMEATWQLESGPFRFTDLRIEEVHYERGPAPRVPLARGGPS